MLARRAFPLFVVLLSLTVAASAQASPASAVSSRADASNIVGLWQNTITCQGLVEAANKAQLRPIASAVVSNYFPTLTPRQPSHGTDICPGQPAGVTHEHFFTSDGFFGSLDENGDVVDFGTYSVLGPDTVFICSELNPPTCASDDASGTFRFMVSRHNLGLRLEPLITPEQRAQALATPNDFTPALWMISVAFAGHTWNRMSCPWC